MSWDDYSAEQLQGSEFGGVERTRATIQLKPAEALTNGEKLRLEYLTGEIAPDNQTSIEDHRAFYGLLPSDKARPFWLENTGRESEAQIREVGFRGDAD